MVIRTEEPKPRYVEVSTREFDGLRLAYAQHVYKAQGLTTDRSLVLTGGWQTDRETSYVALSRARERTDVYTSREDLGHAGIDSDAIDGSPSAPPKPRPTGEHHPRRDRRADTARRPAADLRRAPEAALEHQPDPASDRSRDSSRDRDRDEEQASWFAQALEDIRRQQAEQAHEHDNDLSDGFEL